MINISSSDEFLMFVSEWIGGYTELDAIIRQITLPIDTQLEAQSVNGEF